MIVKITTVEELKKIFAETFLNKTDKVTKISVGSVMNGVSYGTAKLQQKTLKDLSVIETHLFPDLAFGEYLDKYAELNGRSERYSSAKSSCYIRVVGDPGTLYNKTINTFSGQGVTFFLDENFTIPDIGYCYVKVSSSISGSRSNVDPLTITKVSPIPAGHNYCINEYMATGGRDEEDDDDFRRRLKDEINILARTSKSYLEQVFRKINPLVLKVYNLGIDSVGDLVIGVSKVNGENFTNLELSELYNKSEKYFSLSELKPDGLLSYGIKIKNIEYFPIDVSVRVDLDESFDFDTIRKECQINLSKKLDFRSWEDGDIVDWIGLINCIKSVEGVKRVLDNHFFPNNDVIIPRGYLPRIRGFMLLDLQGQIVSNSSGTLNPVYYPNQIDFNYQTSVINSI